jgi:CheY-like chemotaxis protein
MAMREVLIVDDHEGARDALLGMVEDAGYAAVAFADPAAALARIAEHRPALILLDMMMPVIDGADFLTRLGPLHPDGDTIPVIIVSGIGQLLQGLPADVRRVGVVEVLSKPVSYTTLIEAVSRFLGPPNRE